MSPAYVETLSASSPAGDSFKKITMIKGNPVSRHSSLPTVVLTGKEMGLKISKVKADVGRQLSTSHGGRL